LDWTLQQQLERTQAELTPPPTPELLRRPHSLLLTSERRPGAAPPSHWPAATRPLRKPLDRPQRRAHSKGHLRSELCPARSPLLVQHCAAALSCPPCSTLARPFSHIQPHWALLFHVLSGPSLSTLPARLFSPPTLRRPFPMQQQPFAGAATTATTTVYIITQNCRSRKTTFGPSEMGPIKGPSRRLVVGAKLGPISS